MKKLERIMKAFANRRRLTILQYLKKNSEASVGEIAHEIKLSFNATSKHLGILAAADILEKEQRSSQMYYRFAENLEPAAKHIISLL